MSRDMLKESIKNKDRLIPEDYENRLRSLLDSLPDEVPVSDTAEAEVIKRPVRFDIRPFVSAAAVFAVAAAGIAALSNGARNAFDSGHEPVKPYVTASVNETPEVTASVTTVCETTVSVTELTSAPEVSSEPEKHAAVNEHAAAPSVPGEALSEHSPSAAPEAPEVPAEPEKPADSPEKPEAPEAPEVPLPPVPENPFEPDEPEKPEKPDQHEHPEAPVRPEHPEVPAGPKDDKVNEKDRNGKKTEEEFLTADRVLAPKPVHHSDESAEISDIKLP